jgi:hypothetical protein
MRPCQFCGKKFRPDRRQGTRQRACPRQRCQKARHAANCREWHKENPVSPTTAAEKARAFRAEHPDYQRERRDRPRAWERELEQQRLRRQQAHGLREIHEGERDSLIAQVADLRAVALGLVPGGEGERDSIPTEVLARIGRASAASGGDEGECDSIDYEEENWQSRGRRVLERLDSSQRRQRA